MKAALTFVILLLHSIASGQERPKKTPLWPVVKDGDPSCAYRPVYNKTQRLKIYPFSAADSVVLVSFRHHYKNYPLRKGFAAQDSFIEKRTLNTRTINELTDLLYNNFRKKPAGISVITQCFAPRNGIVFYRKGKLVDAAIICFRCSNYRSLSEKEFLGTDCDEKMQRLRLFFRKQGIHFGTDTRVNAYPGEDNGDVPIPPADR